MIIEEESSQETEKLQPEVDTETKPNEGDLVAKRIIDENKDYRNKNRNLRSRADDAEKKLAEFQEKKLEEEGKFKESAEFYKNKSVTLEAKLNEGTGKYAKKVITSQVKAAAAEMGCIDNDALVQLSPLQDLADDMDEDFNIKSERVKEMLAMQREKYPWLFKKAAPTIIDGKISNNTQDLSNETYVAEMAKCNTQKEFNELRKKFGRDQYS